MKRCKQQLEECFFKDRVRRGAQERARGSNSPRCHGDGFKSGIWYVCSGESGRPDEQSQESQTRAIVTCTGKSCRSNRCHLKKKCCSPRQFLLVVQALWYIAKAENKLIFELPIWRQYDVRELTEPPWNSGLTWKQTEKNVSGWFLKIFGYLIPSWTRPFDTRRFS